METARLRLRRFTPADAPALAAYRSDPEVSRYQSWESPVPSAEAERLAATLSAGDPVSFLGRPSELTISAYGEGEGIRSVKVGGEVSFVAEGHLTELPAAGR